MSESEKLIPVLVCQDIAAEHDFLMETLGFSSGGIHRTPDGQLVHGEVRAGGAGWHPHWTCSNSVPATVLTHAQAQCDFDRAGQ